LCLAAGGSLHVVKERLGHQDIRTTINIYAHLLPEQDSALADALGDMWNDAGAEPEESNVIPIAQGQNKGKP
jgi:hypothetical protein